MPAPLISAVAVAIALQSQPAGWPDFGGVWVQDRARSESATQEGAARQVAETITQTPAAVTVVTNRDGRATTVRYPLGAPPAKVDANDVMTAEPRAFWQGTALVNEGSVDIEGQTVSFSQRRTLGPGGGEMTVETTLKLQHGYTLRGAQTMVSGKDVFVRRP